MKTKTVFSSQPACRTGRKSVASMLILLLMPVMMWAQGAAGSYGFNKQAWKDSITAGGQHILVPMNGYAVSFNSPSSGTSGYWSRNVAPHSAAITPTTATDSVLATYLYGTTAVLAPIGAVNAPSFELVGQTSGKAGIYGIASNGIAFSVNNARQFWANGNYVVFDKDIIPTSGYLTSLGIGQYPWSKLYVRDALLGSLTDGNYAPKHTLVGLTSYATNLNGFSFTNADVNKDLSTAAQERDTSSFNLVFTGGASPVLTMKGKDGSTLFLADSVGVRAATYKYNTGIFSAATSDGSDNSYIEINGGGGGGSSRGATIYASGNERGAFEGELVLQTGAVATQGSNMLFRTGASSAVRLRIDELGVITAGTTDSVGTNPFYVGAITASGLSSFSVNGGTVTAGAGDSVQVTVTGISPTTFRGTASYREKAALTDIPAGARCWAANTLTVYGTNTKQLDYTITNK